MNQKVLILHLAHWDQLLGGAEQQLKYLAEYLVNNDYEVHFIFPNRTKSIIGNSKIVNHPIYFRKIYRKLGRFGRTWFIYKRELQTKIKELEPNVIITRTYSAWGGVAAEYAFKNKIRHIHFIASDYDLKFDNKSIPYNKPFDFLEFASVKNLYLGNTELVVQNDKQKNALFENSNLTSLQLNQAAPLNNFELIKKDKRKIKVVWIANFKSVKRPEKFLEIVSHFKNNQRIEFIMIGECNTSHYHDLIKSYKQVRNFRFLGRLENEQVNSILDTVNILVNTSDFEGFSNTFVQAWLRKVVVLSLNSDPNQILEKENIGYKTNIISKMIERLEEFLEDDSKLHLMGDRAMQYAKNNHVINDDYFKRLKL